jgi:cyclic pyranopterin phosphate synthase
MIFRFDEVGADLELLPTAARRALDHAGLRVSRESWRSLSLAARREIVRLGAERVVDATSVKNLASEGAPAPEPAEATPDPPSDRPLPSILDALGPSLTLSDAVWASLTPLERYALAKVTRRGASDRAVAAYREIVGNTAVSTHLASAGGARMVDVAEKAETYRRATAETSVAMSEAAFAKLRAHDVAKGDVLGTARVAGILAAKRTPELIPLCHVVRLTRVTVDCELEDRDHAVRIRATAEAVDRTGVEMEALTAASVAALTVYDMLKSVDRAMTIGPTWLVEKSGGRSGDFRR